MKPTLQPQRIVSLAAPGSLLKHAFSPATKLRLTIKQTHHDEKHLRAIRQCPCLKCGLDPCLEAAHLRMSSGIHNKHGGKAKKPDDSWTLPLCRDCHQTDKDALHKIGEIAFFNFLGIDPLRACERLYAGQGDIPKTRAIAFTIIGERT